MSRSYNHSHDAEVIANRVRLILLIAMIVMFSLLVVNMNDSHGEQMEMSEYQKYVQNLNKGEYEATLTVSTTNGKVTIPVTLVVENDGEFGTVNFTTNEKVEIE